MVAEDVIYSDELIVRHPLGNFEINDSNDICNILQTDLYFDRDEQFIFKYTKDSIEMIDYLTLGGHKGIKNEAVMYRSKQDFFALHHSLIYDYPYHLDPFAFDYYSRKPD